MVQTVAELTRDEYNELAYNAASPVIVDDCIKDICILLGQCGIDIEPTNTYDETVAQAVSDFQTKVLMRPTGILNNATLQAMIYYKERLSDVIEDIGNKEIIVPEPVESGSPHYDPFFSTERMKQHRQNKKDIKIVFGNSSIVKTIKDVHMRSVSVEVDTSGNPISEIYEFVARDIIESDEISDADKYDSVFDLASSDVKGYKFDRVLPDKNSEEESKDA